MIFNSNIIFELARVIGLAQPEHGDSDIRIFPQVSNVVSVSNPLNETSALVSTDVQIGTAHSFTNFVITNGGGGVSGTLLTLAAGLWHFHVMGSLSSNYNQGGLFDAIVELVYGNGQVFLWGGLAGGASAAPTVYAHTRDVQILVPVQSTIRVTGRNNAAGNTLTAAFDVLCLKIL